MYDLLKILRREEFLQAPRLDSIRGQKSVGTGMGYPYWKLSEDSSCGISYCLLPTFLVTKTCTKHTLGLTGQKAWCYKQWRHSGHTRYLPKIKTHTRNWKLLSLTRCQTHFRRCPPIILVKLPECFTRLLQGPKNCSPAVFFNGHLLLSHSVNLITCR
jgi:hypothetical protein